MALFHYFQPNSQELFQKIDLEDDGIVFLKEIVIYLRAMNEDIDDNVDVKVLLDQYETNGEEELKFNHFCVSTVQSLVVFVQKFYFEGDNG